MSRSDMGRLLLLAFVLWFPGSVSTHQSASCRRYELERTEKRVSYGIYEGWQPDAIVRVYTAGERCVVSVAHIFASVQNQPKNTTRASMGTFNLEIAIVSQNFTEIVFDTASVLSSDNHKVLVQLQVDQVRVFIDNLTNFTKIAKIFSWVVSDKSFISTATDNKCMFVDEIVNLWILATDKYFKFKDSIVDLCRGHFTKVFSLTFTSASEDTLSTLTTDFTSILADEFPVLQQLMIEEVNLQGNITFPWVDVFNALNPEKLGDAVTVTKTENRRWFKLSQRTCSNELSPHLMLQGEVSVVVLNNLYCNMKFYKNIVDNVTGLKKLDMTNNCLEFLSNGFLRHQSSLVELTMKENHMFGIEKEAFADLTELKYVDLSKNKLVFLPPELFENLSKLEELRLEENELSAPSLHIFRNQLASLRIVSIHSNPLLDIPPLPFFAPNLRLLDLHNTLINGRSITVLINRLTEPLADIRSFSNNRYYSSPFVPTDIATKVIDLSNCAIEAIVIDSTHKGLILYRLLKTIKFKFDGNPFYCSCGIVNLQATIRPLAQLYPSESKFSENDLICGAPPDFRGRSVVSIALEEMYCPIQNQRNYCPKPCFCSKRLTTNTYIIDCSYKNLSTLPQHVPLEGDLELWFYNASIEQLLPRDYFVNVTVLDLTSNIVRFCDPEAFSQLENLRTLKLQSNLLTTLPREIENCTSLTTLTLSDNPLLCDCHLSWIKTWIAEMRSRVIDITQIKCSDGSKKGVELTTLIDSRFTCSVATGIVGDNTMSIVIVAVASGLFLIIVTVGSFVIYFRGLTVKSLIYVYCGFHPFDKDTGDGGSDIYDAVAIYMYEDHDFMQDVVVSYLNEKGYNVVDMYSDFTIGASFVENVRHFISNSCRLIMCLSDQTMEDELMKVAWSMAYEKAVDSKSNFIILIRNGIHTNDIQDKTIKLYIRNRRYILKDSPVLKKCLKYLMPKPRETCIGAMVNQPKETCNQEHPRTFICYPDQLHAPVCHELLPKLRQHGHNVGVFELEFVPGGALGKEIVDVIERSERLIFIMTAASLADEMKTTVLKTAIVHTLGCRYNFLLLCTCGTIRVREMPSDVRNYVHTHVTTRLEAPDCVRRLSEALDINVAALPHDSDAVSTTTL